MVFLAVGWIFSQLALYANLLALNTLRVSFITFLLWILSQLDVCLYDNLLGLDT